MEIGSFRFIVFFRTIFLIERWGIMIPWFFEEAVGSWWSKLVFCSFFFCILHHNSWMESKHDSYDQGQVPSNFFPLRFNKNPSRHGRSIAMLSVTWTIGFGWIGMDWNGFDGFGWSPGNRTQRTQPHLVHYNSNNSKLGVFQTSWTRNPTKDVFSRVFRFCSKILEAFLLAIWESPNYLETPQLFSNVFSILLIRSIVAACDLCVQSRRPENPRVDSFEGIHDLTAKIGIWFFSYSECPAEWNLQKLSIFKTTKSPTLRFADST